MRAAIGRRLVILAGAAVLAVAAACAPDDEVTTPRPTVPTIVAATPAAPSQGEVIVDGGDPQLPQPDRGQSPDQPSNASPLPTDQPSNASPLPTDQPSNASPLPSDQQHEDEAAPAGASAAESAPPEPEPSREVPPDGNMFAAGIDTEQLLMLDEPIDMAVAPGDDLAWIAERPGRVLRVDLGTGTVIDTVLDITDETDAEGERGLLGIAVTERWLYVNFTDANGDTRVDAFERDGTGLGEQRRTILFQPQPFSNHNGGDLAVGPDGLLYVGFGDGGSGGDPLGHGQNPQTWLGSILRVDPTPGASEPYSVPPGNPYATLDGDQESDAGGRSEIFLIGVRNPWRFSFDRATGDLWIADVGQDHFEEVTVLLAANGGGAGANLGWRLREGLHAFEGDKPEANIDPVWEYGRDDGCSVTGGYVYRGAAIEDLFGAYVFGDYCTARLWGVQISRGEVEFWDLGAEVPGGSLAGFGQDADGEMYTLSLNGPVARIVPR